MCGHKLTAVEGCDCISQFVLYRGADKGSGKCIEGLALLRSKTGKPVVQTVVKLLDQRCGFTHA